MSLLSVILLLILIVFILTHYIYVAPPITHGSSGDVKTDDAEDIQAIQALTKTMVQGWNTGDGELYSSVFGENADYVTFNGERYIGREHIAEAHQELFDGVLKGSTFENVNIISIRFPLGHTAIVHMTGYVKQKWRKKAPESRKSIQTLVAIRKNEEWRFTSFHNTRVQRFTLADVIKMMLN